jgi:hypothetical protein
MLQLEARNTRDYEYLKFGFLFLYFALRPETFDANVYFLFVPGKNFSQEVICNVAWRCW